jgi:hypothetical protein
LDWHYAKKYVEVSMPGYVRDALTRFRHATPTTLEYAPHLHTPIKYGKMSKWEWKKTRIPQYQIMKRSSYNR